MTADSPRASLALIQSPIASSHGQRSSSVSGCPVLILATLASEWKASPSANSHPVTVEIPLATVDLPDPETPMTTTWSGFPAYGADAPMGPTVDLAVPRGTRPTGAPAQVRHGVGPRPLCPVASRTYD